MARYNGSGNGSDIGQSMAVSPDGRRVFVTGEIWGLGTGYDYATVAYSAAAGKQLWASRYSGPGQNKDYPWAVAVSPDGRRVFVTGYARGWGPTVIENYVTVAYDAATGRQLRARRYNGPASGFDMAFSMAVSPHGSKVFVAGESCRRTDCDYATIAYSAATGRYVPDATTVPGTGAPAPNRWR